MNVWLAVLPLVVRDASPKLLLNPNVPFPPTVFFTTWIDPCWVLVNVQVVVAPAATVTAAGVPLVQVALATVDVAVTARLERRAQA